MQENFSNLKQWLTSHLANRQMSVIELAARAGTTRASIYYYMQDKCRPTRNQMATICAALGVPLEEGLSQYTERKIGRPKGKTSAKPQEDQSTEKDS